MGLMGGLFKVLGFEGDEKVKKNNKKTSVKGSYKLKNGKSERTEQIDGVPVYYPTSIDQVKDFLEFVKKKKAIIISTDSCGKETALRVVDFLKGFTMGANAKFILLNEDGLYLILPEGMEVE